MRSKLLSEFRPGPFGAVMWEGHDPLRYGHALLLLALEQEAVMGLRDAANDTLLLMEAEPAGFKRLCRDLERPETRALIAAYIRDPNEGTALRVLIPWRDKTSLDWPEAELRINLEPLRAALQERGIAAPAWRWEVVPDDAIPALQGGHPTARPGAVEALTEALEGQGEPNPPEQREPSPVRPEGVTAAHRP